MGELCNLIVLIYFQFFCPWCSSQPITHNCRFVAHVQVSTRRSKTQAAQLAQLHHNTHVQAQAWDVWKKRQHQQLYITSIIPLVDSMRQRVIVRRALEHWKHFTKQIRLRKTLFYQANQHYYFQTLRRTMMHMRYAYVLSQQRHTQVIQAAAFNRHRIQHYWLSVWKAEYEEAQEIKLAPLTQLARSHAQRQLLQTCLVVWKQHCANSRAERFLEQRADNYRRRRLQRLSVRVWLQHIETSRRKQWLNDKADRFRRLSVFSSFFVHWTRVHAFVSHQRALEEEAAKYHATRLLALSFTVWRINMDKSRRLIQQGVLANVHRNHFVLRQALQCWQDRAEEFRAKREMRETADTYFRTQTLRQTWQAWHMRTEDKLAEAVDTEMASHHRRKVLLHQCWLKWQQLVQEARHTRLQWLAASTHHSTVLKLQVVKIWRSNAEEQRAYTSRSLQADAHFQSLCVKRCFRALAAHTESQAHAAEGHEATLVKWQSSQNGQLLQNIWHKWRNAAECSADSHRKRELAVLTHNRALKRSAFDAWEAWSRRHRLKVRLKRQAAHFRRFHALSAVFSKWKLVLFQARFEEEKDCLALWLWSVQVKRRAFCALLQHYKQQKTMQQRRNEALERRRKYLVHRSINQWIRVASDMSLQVMNETIANERDSAVALHARVRKFAQRWHRIVINKKTNHATPPNVPAARLGTHRHAASLPPRLPPTLPFAHAPHSGPHPRAQHPLQQHGYHDESGSTATPHSAYPPVLRSNVIEAWEPLPKARPAPRRLPVWAMDHAHDLGGAASSVAQPLVHAVCKNMVPNQHLGQAAAVVPAAVGSIVGKLVQSDKHPSCTNAARAPARQTNPRPPEVTDEQFAAMKATLDGFQAIKLRRKELEASLQKDLGLDEQGLAAARSMKQRIQALVRATYLLALRVA